ncbi:hypothetical protein DV517_24760 [Streptomyces sp. S816]|nr:hypothetical protein DV517_24760 [Streptomyces sp. S816]
MEAAAFSLVAALSWSWDARSLASPAFIRARCFSGVHLGSGCGRSRTHKETELLEHPSSARISL